MSSVEDVLTEIGNRFEILFPKLVRKRWRNTRIYKEKQYLIFDYEDGRTVKYDFATKTAIGIKGKTVKGLQSQLSGMTIKEFMTYHHMVAVEKKKKAIKQFMEQAEFKYCDVEQIEYEPHFKNMYRVREQENLWMYGEAGYGAAVG